MDHSENVEQSRFDPEPRWPALVAILAVGGLYTALPESLIIGPRWAFMVIVLIMLVPTVISHYRNTTG